MLSLKYIEIILKRYKVILEVKVKSSISTNVYSGWEVYRKQCIFPKEIIGLSKN